MSGSLTSLTQLTGNVPVLGGLTSLISGLLSAASWRGLPFYMLSGGDEAGPRAVRFAYPNMARADWQFMGAEDGPMPVQGVLIGTDCTTQWARMRAACQLGGQGKLRHPWFGQFDAVVVGRVRADFTEQQFGIIRFSVTFERFLPAKPPARDWFGQLQDQVTSLLGAATDLLDGVMGDLAAPLALYSFATGLLAQAATVWTGLGLGAGGSDITAAVAPAVLALQTASPTFDNAFPGTVAALLAAPAQALADASQPVQAPAIGAGPLATVSDASVDPAVAAPALLTATAGLAAPGNATQNGQAVALAAQMQAAAQAAAVGATIPFASTNDAAAWVAQLDAALDGLQQQAAALAVFAPLVAGPAWRALAALRTAAAATNSALQVNLPSLVSVTTTRTMDAWAIALALFGDTPSLLPGAVQDLWARNPAARNPAAVPPGTYWVLPPA